MDKFIANFEKKVKKTILDNKLFTKKEKVFVAVSGGKDSMTILYLLKKFGYNIEAFIIDLAIGSWSERHLVNVKAFCKELDVKLNIVDLRREFGGSMCFFRSAVQKKAKLSNCMICGIIKKWLLNKRARELGAKKLVTGHNLDDEAETVFMNILRGNVSISLGLGPRTGLIQDKKFVQRVKPLYWCLNEDVKKYSEIMKFPVIYEPCPCAVKVFRGDIRQKFSDLDYPNVKENLVKGFLKILPELQAKNKSLEKLKYCKTCGEPSRNEECKMCKLFKIVKGEKDASCKN